MSDESKRDPHKFHSRGEVVEHLTNEHGWLEGFAGMNTADVLAVHRELTAEHERPLIIRLGGNVSLDTVHKIREELDAALERNRDRAHRTAR